MLPKSFNFLLSTARIAAIIVTIAAIVTPDIALTLSPEQKNAISSGAYYFDTEVVDACNNSNPVGGQAIVSADSLSLREKIAQMFIIGVSSRQQAIEVVTEHKVGGIYTNTAPVDIYNNETISQLNSLSDVPLAIPIDQEGGRVERLEDIIGSKPSAKTLGSTPTDEVRSISEEHGRQLRELGITMNFAPVLDLDDGSNSIISQKDRAFSSDPEVIAEKAGAFADGMRDAGITPTFKHFPGHGFADGDSHNQTVVVPHIDTLAERDLVPYQRLLGSSTGAVMIGHLIIPGLTQGSELEQATINPDAVNYLRDNFEFEGVIVTDEIANMVGIRGAGYTAETAVQQAVRAGIDMPLFDKDASSQQSLVDQITETIDLVEQDVIDGVITEQQIGESVQRIFTMKSLSSSNVQSGNSASCCTAQLSGDSNEAKVWNFLISKNLTVEQAAGVMGNLAVESGFDPFNQENDKTWPNGGWGLPQWTGYPTRRGSIRDAVIDELGEEFYIPTEEAASFIGTPQEDKLLEFQLNYLYEESLNRDVRQQSTEGIEQPFDAPNEWEGLKRMNTVEEAIIYWEWNYERAGVPALGTRLSRAQDIIARLGSQVNPTGGCQSGVPGQYVLPLDQSFYSENDYYFKKTHHDYPAADIPIVVGTPVYSMAAGTVVSAPTGGGCGIGVVIQSDNGVRISYCHGIDGGSIEGAREGDTVLPGQLIMHSGDTGNSTGPHLHLGFKVEDVSVCPQYMFVGIAEGNIPNIADLPNSGCTHVNGQERYADGLE